MSIQNARDFLAKAAKDEEFRNRLDGCKTEAELLRFARGAGFTFTDGEVRAARAELQDADLDLISGGVILSSPCPRDLPPCSLFPG